MLTDTAQREGTRLQAPSERPERLPPCSCGPQTMHKHVRVRIAGISRYRSLRMHRGLFVLRWIELGWNHERARPYADGALIVLQEKGYDQGHERLWTPHRERGPGCKPLRHVPGVYPLAAAIAKRESLVCVAAAGHFPLQERQGFVAA